MLDFTVLGDDHILLLGVAEQPVLLGGLGLPAGAEHGADDHPNDEDEHERRARDEREGADVLRRTAAADAREECRRRPRLFEIWHSAMWACFEKGVDALGFTFQVHTTIDSKLCRPFRRFDRFYSGERKPGDDASD